MIYISPAAHQKLKLLAARRNRPMGQVVEELIEEHLAELLNPWTSPEGLMLQQQVLAQVWDDPALDVYNHAEMIDRAEARQRGGLSNPRHGT